MHQRSKHRRKRLARLVIDPSEQTSEFPGFFVLSRADTPSRRRAVKLKAVLLGLVVIGGLISGVAYFFLEFGCAETAAAKESSPVLSDPLSFHPSIDYGVVWR